MSKSPTSPKHETADCSCYEFDPHVNFSQFLEEARQHARDINLRRSSSCSEEVGKIRLGAEKKSKKSWRNSLFSWCKIDRKCKPGSGPVHVSNSPKPLNITVRVHCVEPPRESKHQAVVHHRGRSPSFSPLQGRWKMSKTAGAPLTGRTTS
ncbi:hypothetical protein V6N13_132660 [Hibiscus sabdariffa]|uniref:Uncharacterized protein n=1 Tax=Hibiscus sabdariffa TaxID=183260 RepID=A0ABR2PVW6_9ROSI